jgi:hypothetical protein
MQNGDNVAYLGWMLLRFAKTLNQQLRRKLSWCLIHAQTFHRPEFRRIGPFAMQQRVGSATLTKPDEGWS